MAETLRPRLQAYCARHWAAPRVSDLIELSAGWECDLYSFTLEHGSETPRAREDLILRLYPGDGAPAKAVHEFESLRQLHQAGYPVPQVHALEPDSAVLGLPFVVMEKIEGEVMWPRLVGAHGPEQQRLLAQFCSLFAQLHALDWRQFAPAGAAATPASYTFVDRWLSTTRQALRRVPMPGFRASLAWLEARRDAMPCPRPSPIHHDFHPENVLLRPDGSAVVIDWTGFHVSDARFDLGTAWRLGLLRGYEAAAGARVAQVECFEVAACLRRLFDLAVSLRHGPERQGMRPEAAQAIREDMPAHRRVYQRLLEHTGISMPEVEELLEG